MALTAASVQHYWNARYGHIPVIGGKPTHLRSGIATWTDQSGVLQTAPANTPRFNWSTLDGKKRPVLRLESSRTNNCLWCRDLTNAAWVKVTMTTAKTEKGVDGTDNSATKCTATGANSTVLQSITLANSTRYLSAYVRRVAGVGTVEMTLDGGATWAAIVLTTAWTRFLNSQLLTNPSIGFRIQTNGDAIAVDYVQLEGSGTNQRFTSPILTTTVAITRADDFWMWDMPLDTPLDIAVYLRGIEKASVVNSGSNRYAQLGDDSLTTPRFAVFRVSSTQFEARYDNGAGGNQIVDITTTPARDEEVEMLLRLRSGQMYLAVSRNEAASVNGNAAIALGAGRFAPKLMLNSNATVGANITGAFEYAEIKVVKHADLVNDAGTHDDIMTEMRKFELDYSGALINPGA